jgi:hypothetical protein
VNLSSRSSYSTFSYDEVYCDCFEIYITSVNSYKVVLLNLFPGKLEFIALVCGSDFTAGSRLLMHMCEHTHTAIYILEVFSRID